MKPIMFLDVDDTVLRFRGKTNGKPAFLAKEFFLWSLENFECRPLTMWATAGWFFEERAVQLAGLLEVHPDLVRNWKNPLGFREYKTEALNWDELKDRRWVWVEDGLLRKEIDILKENKSFPNFISCNVSHNGLRLAEVWIKLSERFHIPLPEDVKPQMRKNFKI